MLFVHRQKILKGYKITKSRKINKQNSPIKERTDTQREKLSEPKAMRVLNISLKRNLTTAQVVMEFCLKQVPLTSNGPSQSDIYPEPGGKTEKVMATHSSTLAWKIPWAEEPGRLQREELDMTERLHFHFSLSCIGEGNGNPLQCSCLENPSDGGAWWAAIYGVAQSWTRLKRLSSSSSSRRQEEAMSETEPQSRSWTHSRPGST